MGKNKYLRRFRYLNRKKQKGSPHIIRVGYTILGISKVRICVFLLVCFYGFSVMVLLPNLGY